MNNFTPILSQPNDLLTNKYWLHTSVGGLNSCILISNGLTIPNCVGYSWGRAYMVLGSKPKLARTNANTWYLYTKDGYSRGQTPKLGAIACWSGGSSGKGHVANVEQIKSDGTIVCSNSGITGGLFFMKEYKPPYNSGNLTFQGFIYILDDVEATASTDNGTQLQNGTVYFKFGDKDPKIGTVASLMRKVFPAYSPKSVLGNLLGVNLQKSLKEFQKRTKIAQTGNIDEATVNQLKKWGLKW